MSPINGGAILFSIKVMVILLSGGGKEAVYGVRNIPIGKAS